jgi:hypothetical protein
MAENNAGKPLGMHLCLGVGKGSGAVDQRVMRGIIDYKREASEAHKRMHWKVGEGVVNEWTTAYCKNTSEYSYMPFPRCLQSSTC